MRRGYVIEYSLRGADAFHVRYHALLDTNGLIRALQDDLITVWGAEYNSEAQSDSDLRDVAFLGLDGDGYGLE